MDFSYHRPMVACATKECDEIFLKTGPLHKYCKYCAVDRQKERLLRYNEKKAARV
jgi:hypothetical protein